MRGTEVVVFGGSGFIGRHLVSRLAKAGATIRVAVRDVQKALFLRTCGEVGQVTPISVNGADAKAVLKVSQGAHVLINLTGLLFERGSQTFENVHLKGAENIARAAHHWGAQRLVHLSALGADPHSTSTYAATKGKAEQLVLKHFPEATILRPSVVFGWEDQFLNRFAAMATWSPFLVVFGGGKTQFQPIYVGDVVEAILKALEKPETRGKTYELGGSKVYTFKELLELLLRQIKRSPIILPLPYTLGSLLAWFLERLPHPLLTRDQLKLLKQDNLVSSDSLSLKDLGVIPKPLESWMQEGLSRFMPRF